MKTIKQKIEEGREYRDAKAFEVRASEESNEYTVEGYATTFDEPYFLYRIDEDIVVYEQISSKAFEETDMTDVIMQYDHEGHVYARLSNDTMKLSFDEHGLKVEANLSGTTIGRQLQEEIDGGYTCKMSWGFSIIPDSDTVELIEEKDGVRKYLRTITKVEKIYDVSAVSLPANDMTEISSHRNLNGLIQELEAERLEKLESEKRRKAKAKALKLKLGLKKGNSKNA